MTKIIQFIAVALTLSTPLSGQSNDEVPLTFSRLDLTDGRFESQGKAFIEYYDSRGRSYQRTTSTFEVITERKAGEELTVVSFSRKS